MKSSFQKKNERLEAQKKNKKRKEEEREKNDSKTTLKNKLKSEEKELAENLKASQKMLENAQKIISDGIKEKDMTTVESGQILLSEATSRVSDILAEQERNRQKLSKLESNNDKKKKL